MEYENLNFSKFTKVPLKKLYKTAKEFGCDPKILSNFTRAQVFKNNRMNALVGYFTYIFSDTRSVPLGLCLRLVINP